MSTVDLWRRRNNGTFLVEFAAYMAMLVVVFLIQTRIIALVVVNSVIETM
jgi:hypothetical protein